LKCDAGEKREIGYTNRVKSEEVLHRVKEEKNILHAIKGGYANCISIKRPYSKLPC
jgi:hypothetical protein